MRTAAAAALTALAALGLASCGVRAPAPAALPVAPAAPAVSATVSPPTGVWWEAPVCGDYAYPRRLILQADGRFTHEDRIAPCPPKALCVWSGIVRSGGRWQAMPDGAIALDSPPPQPGSLRQRVPARLRLQADGNLHESAACTWQRLPNEPAS